MANVLGDIVAWRDETLGLSEDFMNRIFQTINEVWSKTRCEIKVIHNICFKIICTEEKTFVVIEIDDDIPVNVYNSTEMHKKAKMQRFEKKYVLTNIGASSIAKARFFEKISEKMTQEGFKSDFNTQGSNPNVLKLEKKFLF